MAQRFTVLPLRTKDSTMVRTLYIAWLQPSNLYETIAGLAMINFDCIFHVTYVMPYIYAYVVERFRHFTFWGYRQFGVTIFEGLGHMHMPPLELARVHFFAISIYRMFPVGSGRLLSNTTRFPVPATDSQSLKFALTSGLPVIYKLF